MKKVEKIVLMATVFLSGLTIILWSIGVFQEASEDSIVCDLFKISMISTLIAYVIYGMALVYNVEIKEQ